MPTDVEQDDFSVIRRARGVAFKYDCYKWEKRGNGKKTSDSIEEKK